ncbi:ParB N-terminal domain-containing protein [Nitratidesulfovibrio sp. D1]|uniref:ParB N-terminal domain-containing protein n=1 Tax=Nitratidesulfovibrio sp. D1 TaxID=3440151 RepID=UPI003EBB7B5F
MQGQEEQTVLLPIANIIRDERLQFRDKVIKTRVEQYAGALKAGKILPAIRVADINGVYYLVDGWHRIRAHELWGFDDIEAEVVSCASFREAIIEAAIVNHDHGKSSRTVEARRAFRAFIDNQGHVVSGFGKKKFLTYREIGEKFSRPHTTITSWMKSDYPKIAEEISRAAAIRHGRPYPKPSDTDIDDDSNYTPPPPNPDGKSLAVLKSYLSHIRAKFTELKTVDAAAEAVQELDTLRNELADHMARTFPALEHPDF